MCLRTYSYISAMVMQLFDRLTMLPSGSLTVLVTAAAVSSSETAPYQSHGYFATDDRSFIHSFIHSVSQSVSPSVLASSPSGTRDHILVVVKTVAILSWGIFPLKRTGLSCNSAMLKKETLM